MRANGLAADAKSAPAHDSSRFNAWPWIGHGAAVSACGVAASWWAAQVDPTFYIAVYGALGLAAIIAFWVRWEPAPAARRFAVLAQLESVYLHGVLCPLFLWNRALFDPVDSMRNMIVLTAASVLSSVVVWRARIRRAPVERG